MPQLVHGTILAGSTYFIARRMVAATSSGVSALSLATSMQPTSTSLPFKRPMNSIGTFELATSRLTWSIRLFARAGKMRSYWRHSSPSVFFQSMFAWMPFLAADLGGILGGYLSPFLMGRFKLGLLTSRAAGVGLGAVLMIAPACVGLVHGPLAAIALFCVGGFAHQMISVLINTLTTDVFPRQSLARANGLVGMMGWTGGLLFSLLVGALADRTGFGPLFALLGVFDVAGALVLFALLRPAARDRLRPATG